MSVRSVTSQYDYRSCHHDNHYHHHHHHHHHHHITHQEAQSGPDFRQGAKTLGGIKIRDRLAVDCSHNITNDLAISQILQCIDQEAALWGKGVDPMHQNMPAHGGLSRTPSPDKNSLSPQPSHFFLVVGTTRPPGGLWGRRRQDSNKPYRITKTLIKSGRNSIYD